METYGSNNALKGLNLIILPLLTNTSLLLFLCFSIDLYAPTSDPRNIIGVVGIFIYYFGCLALFFAYGKSTHGLHELFGHAANNCLIICIMISYPIFYLFWLPYILYQFLVYAGTPKAIWEKMFTNTVMSFENLYSEFASNCCVLFTRYIYIGVPFVLFALLYIVIIVILTPLWYFILSPIGLGTFGICLHVSLHFPHSTEVDLKNRANLSYRWGTFIHVYALAIPCILLAGIYIGVVGPEWQAILMLILTGLHFLIDVIPSTKGICVRSTFIDNVYM